MSNDSFNLPSGCGSKQNLLLRLHATNQHSANTGQTDGFNVKDRQTETVLLEIMKDPDWSPEDLLRLFSL